MGSFNTTCFVSQQTIVPGAQAYIIPIYQSHNYNKIILEANGNIYEELGNYSSTCYPTSFWDYAGPIFKGKYDDYGCFVLNDTDENHNSLVVFFDSLLEKLFITQQGENEYHDLPIDFKTIYNYKKEYSFTELHEIWDKMWEVGQKGRLYISDFDNNPCQLQFSVIHEATANYLMNDFYNKGDDHRKEYFKNYIKKPLEEIFDDEKKSFFFISRLFSLERFNIGEGTGAYYHFYSDIGSLSEDIIKEYESEKLEDCLSELTEKLYNLFSTQIEHRYIHHALCLLNIKLSPMVYASQDYSNDIGIDYKKMVNNVNAKIIEEIKARWDEYDDEQEDKFILINVSFPDNLGLDTKIVKMISTDIDTFKKDLENKVNDYLETNKSLVISLNEGLKLSLNSSNDIMNSIHITEIPQEDYDIIVKYIGERSGPIISLLENEPVKLKNKMK